MRVFTTGQAAKVLKVAPRYISRMYDSGRLKGYRVPGSQDRRIPAEYLLKFCRDNDLPCDDLEALMKEDAE